MSGLAIKLFSRRQVKRQKGEGEVSERQQYLNCGLDNVWIEGGISESQTPDGPHHSIQDRDGLHRSIAQCLINKTGPLSGREFKFLRKALGMSQLVAGQLCGLSERTIRTLEKGKAPVSEPANTLIRFVCQQRRQPRENLEQFSKIIQRLVDSQRPQEINLKHIKGGWRSAHRLEIVA